MRPAIFFIASLWLVCTANPARAQSGDANAYCLHSNTGDMIIVQACRFATREQCMQARVSNADRCVPNPAARQRKQ